MLRVSRGSGLGDCSPYVFRGKILQLAALSYNHMPRALQRDCVCEFEPCEFFEVLAWAIAVPHVFRDTILQLAALLYNHEEGISKLRLLRRLFTVPNDDLGSLMEYWLDYHLGNNKKMALQCELFCLSVHTMEVIAEVTWVPFSLGSFMLPRSYIHPRCT